MLSTECNPNLNFKFMSKLTTINETALKELMVSIRRNAKDSACIGNFELLLHEISDPEFVNVTVCSMFNFLTEAFELFQVVDRVPQKKYRARMLTTEFLEPLRFFGRVRAMADESMKLRAAIESVEGTKSPVTVDTDRKPLRPMTDREKAVLINDAFRFTREVETEKGKAILLDKKSYGEICQGGLDPEKSEAFKELARRKMLIWNYIPGVIKAILQTKRRSLGMDNNSKRFE